MKCITLAIVCVALFTQSYTANVKVRDAKDDAEKAFESMMAAIDKALTEASAALDKAVDQVKEKAADLEDKAEAALDKALEPLVAKLNTLVEEAKAMGLDITDCEHYVDDLTNLPNKLVDELIACITNQVDKAQSYVDDALNNCKQIEQDMAGIKDEIESCSGNKWKEIECLAKVVVEIAKDTADAPQHIIEDVTKATLLISELLPIIEECFSEKVNRVETDGLEIIANFAVCAGVPN